LQKETAEREGYETPGGRILFRDEAEFQKKKTVLVSGGPEHVHFVVDFDRTLTAHKLEDGSVASSSHGALESPIVFDQDTLVHLKELTEKYYPIEICHEKTQEEKIPFMLEWWGTAHELMLKAKVKQTAIGDCVRASSMALRKGARELLLECRNAQIPLLLFSAGLHDVIVEALKMWGYGEDKNIHVVSNRMIFNGGEITGFTEPIIHTFCKNEGSARTLLGDEYTQAVDHRESVILLGDSLGDVHMIDGASGLTDTRKNVIRIGFLNDKFDDLREKYLNEYDVVLEGDCSMKFVLDLLRSIEGFGGGTG